MSNEILFSIRFWEQLIYTLIFVYGCYRTFPAAWQDRNLSSISVFLSWLSITLVNLSRLLVIPLNIFYAEAQPLWLPWFLHLDALVLALSIICVGFVIRYRMEPRIAQQLALLGTSEGDLIRQLEAERQKSLQLQRLNEDLKHFAYAAAHDLRAPLRAILGFVEVLAGELEEMGQKTPLIAQAMGHITAGSNKLLALIDALADYNRVEIQRDNFQEVDLVRLIGSVTQDLNETLRQKGTKVEIRPLPPIWGDPDKLYHVFQNLIDNAAKFGASEIVVSGSQAEKGTATITITDNGIGIHPDYHQTIFKIFQRLHLEEDYSGTGVGLAICSKIVKQHGGLISVESEEGKGASFSIQLPPGPNGQKRAS